MSKLGRRATVRLSHEECLAYCRGFCVLADYGKDFYIFKLDGDGLFVDPQSKRKFMGYVSREGYGTHGDNILWDKE